MPGSRATVRPRPRTRADLAPSQIQVAEAAAESRKSQAEIAEIGGQRDQVLRQAAEAQVDTLRRQVADLQAQRTERGIVLTVGDVLFDTGQATLKPGAINESAVGGIPPGQSRAPAAHRGPHRQHRVDSTNLVLSQRRAEAVADALVSAGVSRDRIVATGLGPDFPVASNATAAGGSRTVVWRW